MCRARGNALIDKGSLTRGLNGNLVGWHGSIERFCEGAALVEGPNSETLNAKTTLTVKPSLAMHSQAIKIRRDASHHWEQGDKARCEWLEWTTPNHVVS